MLELIQEFHISFDPKNTQKHRHLETKIRKCSQSFFYSQSKDPFHEHALPASTAHEILLKSLVLSSHCSPFFLIVVVSITITLPSFIKLKKTKNVTVQRRFAES